MTREEAIEVYKGLINTKIKEAFEFFAPELRESEDERMIKAVEHILYENYSDAAVIEGVEIAEIVTWLEKRKEQKPNLVPKVIRPKFAVGDTVCKPMWSDHTVREIYIDCDDPVYVCVNEEGTESHISFSEQDEWERKEQKPIEINEEDERIRKIIRLALIASEDELTNFYKVHNTCRKECTDWLKKQKEQKPAEWSDEDELFLGVCKNALSKYERSDKWDASIISKWLESRLKSSLLQPAGWSKVDKNRLEEAIDVVEANGCWVRSDDAVKQVSDFLKSLPERFNLQPKQEWSEEDETNLELVTDCIYEFYPDPVMKYRLKDWLKDLRPQPK